MSLIQKSIDTTLEVSYSSLRKQNMKALGETNCSLVINNVKHVLQNHIDSKIEITVPSSNKQRIADVFFDFKITSDVKLDNIKKEIENKLGASISKVELFVE